MLKKENTCAKFGITNQHMRMHAGCWTLHSGGADKSGLYAPDHFASCTVAVTSDIAIELGIIYERH